ncbi:MAG: hypothetical protein ACKPKO_03295, partial [Candidatus Fonsibacter sp.]
YELMPGYKWGGVFMDWTLDEFSYIDLCMKESGLARRQRKPHKFKAIDLSDGDIVFPLKVGFRQGKLHLGRDQGQRDVVRFGTPRPCRCLRADRITC